MTFFWFLVKDRKVLQRRFDLRDEKVASYVAMIFGTVPVNHVSHACITPSLFSAYLVEWVTIINEEVVENFFLLVVFYEFHFS